MWFVTWVRWDNTDGISFDTEHFGTEDKAKKFALDKVLVEAEGMEAEEELERHLEYANADFTERFQIYWGVVDRNDY